MTRYLLKYNLKRGRIYFGRGQVTPLLCRPWEDNLTGSMEQCKAAHLRENRVWVPLCTLRTLPSSSISNWTCLLKFHHPPVASPAEKQTLSHSHSSWGWLWSQHSTCWLRWCWLWGPQGSSGWARSCSPQVLSWLLTRQLYSKFTIQTGVFLSPSLVPIISYQGSPTIGCSTMPRGNTSFFLLKAQAEMVSVVHSDFQ